MPIAMELTCLSNFPPCHILTVQGLTILINCPLDLSALNIFAPLPNAVNRTKFKRSESSDNGSTMIFAEPVYKSVAYLQLYDPCLIDIVLITSPMAMLGLPYLTREEGFAAKVYSTEAAARIGKLMMDDLVTLHSEFIQFYGADETKFPNWMEWEYVEALPSSLRDAICGENGGELSGWKSLYNSVDVKECFEKLHALNYGEETSYNRMITLKPYSSTSEIGSCNWAINGAHGSIAYVDLGTEFDTSVLDERDLVILSESSSQTIDFEGREQMGYMCSCSSNAVKAGGSVLIPLCGIGNCFQMMKYLLDYLDSSSNQVPVYFIGSVAEQLLRVVGAMPEFTMRGEEMLSFTYCKTRKNFHVYSAVHSPDFLANWKEPCIVFCFHWSLRLGPAVHLLSLFRKNPNSLLFLEEGLDAELLLLPFHPIQMKIVKITKKRPYNPEAIRSCLLPNTIVLANDAKKQLGTHYAKGETLKIPNWSSSMCIKVSSEIMEKLRWGKLQDVEDVKIAKLEGEVCLENGTYKVVRGDEKSGNFLDGMFWGNVDIEKLMGTLLSMGIVGTVERDSVQNGVIVRVDEPDKGRIIIKGMSTTICSYNSHLCDRLYYAVSTALDSLHVI